MGEIKGGFTRHCRVKDKSTQVISKHLKLIYLKFKDQILFGQGSELVYSYKIAYYDMVSKGTDSFFLSIQEMQSVLFSVAQNLLSDSYKLICTGIFGRRKVGYENSGSHTEMVDDSVYCLLDFFINLPDFVSVFC